MSQPPIKNNRKHTDELLASAMRNLDADIPKLMPDEPEATKWSHKTDLFQARVSSLIGPMAAVTGTKVENNQLVASVAVTRTFEVREDGTVTRLDTKLKRNDPNRAAPTI